MHRNTFLALLLVFVAAVGCSGGGSEMSKDELDRLNNPSKEIPKEAQEGMAKMGDLMEQQKKANEAAGVDDRGVPISKN
jgi:hypothetical protein